MKKFGICLVLVFAAGAVMAQDWNLREQDIPLDQMQAQGLTAGSRLVFPDNGQSMFSVGGAYSYTFPGDGGTEFGRFTVEKDGRVCIDLYGGQSSCNLFVRRGELLLVITDRGDRWPIRIEMGLKP